jgi:cupin fold WbuC family metalloprotein
MRPHRHIADGRQEFFVCLEGEVLLVTFAETGVINAVFHMGTGELSKVSSVMIEPSVWHTLVCVSEQAMLLEVKPGPFQPQLAKEFAPWSPEEDDPRGMSLLDQAIALFAQQAGTEATRIY